MRVGFGFDAHQLVAGKELKLGGARIEFEMGLQGHSDGDVVLHALSDAILGACAMGDIGVYFRDDDRSIAGIDSRDIIHHAIETASRCKMKVNNIDLVIVADKPRLNTHYGLIARSVGEQCGIATSRVSVKSKTTEGTLVSEKSVACFAVVLMEEL